MAGFAVTESPGRPLAPAWPPPLGCLPGHPLGASRPPLQPLPGRSLAALWPLRTTPVRGLGVFRNKIYINKLPINRTAARLVWYAEVYNM